MRLTYSVHSCVQTFTDQIMTSYLCNGGIISNAYPAPLEPKNAIDPHFPLGHPLKEGQTSKRPFRRFGISAWLSNGSIRAIAPVLRWQKIFGECY